MLRAMMPRAPVSLTLGRLQLRASHAALLAATGARLQRVAVNRVSVPVYRLGRGRPLLILHGFGDRADSWLPMAALLHREFEIVLPDLPGFGDADEVTPDDITMQAQARFVAGLLDHLGLDDVHLAGQSMGGAVAARFGNDFPHRIRSLTLLSSAGPKGLHPELQAEADAGRNPLVVSDFEGFQRLCWYAFARRRAPFPRALLLAVAERWAQRPAAKASYFERLMAPIGHESVPAELRPPNCPVRIVYGRQERVVHLDNPIALAGHLSRGAVQWLDGVGHVPHFEAPMAVARILREVAAS
jgi:pimeloyl-ACP methyl ester carboxylesterase